MFFSQKFSTQNSLNDGYSSQLDPLLQSKKSMLLSPIDSTPPFYTPTMNKNQLPSIRSAITSSSNRQSPVPTNRVYRETTA